MQAFGCSKDVNRHHEVKVFAERMLRKLVELGPEILCTAILLFVLPSLLCSCPSVEVLSNQAH